MADVAAVSTQLRQWSFEKPAATRSDRSDSAASSPDLSHSEPDTLRIHAAAVHQPTDDAPAFQERYLSSEEDLSPLDANSSDDDYDDDDDDYASDVEIHEATATPATPSFFRARTMSIAPREKQDPADKAVDKAVAVSYVSVGRPKVIQLAHSPVLEPPVRSTSLAQLPPSVVSKLRQQDQRTRSLIVNPVARPESPASSLGSRRPSTGNGPYTHSNKSAVLLSDSSSQSSLHSGSTSRSSSPSVSERSIAPRPASAAGSVQPRSSLYIVSSVRSSTAYSHQRSPFPPMTPVSSEPHAFLSSDPYESTTTNAASPIIKQSPHKRLRSISQRLSLARIAIAPSKKYDSRANGSNRNSMMPPTPSTPQTPQTPQTAPLPTTNKLRRNSRLMPSRPGTARGPSPDIPPIPSSPRNSKLVARGANEREPILELPPCPVEDEGVATLKTRRIRKRKSLMDLL